MSNMSQLPVDILNQIMDLLTDPDIFRFACVCTSWRSASTIGRHKLRLPWLVVPSEYNDKETGNVWFGPIGLFSILDKKVYNLDIPEIEEHRICGSSNGWLITVNETSDIRLLHPFTREIIDLPSLLEFPEIVGLGWSNIRGGLQYSINVNDVTFRHSSIWVRDNYIRKAIVCSKSTCDKASLVVMVIAEDELFFCRPGMEENTWIQVQGGKENFDVTYYKGKFYAIDGAGNVVVVEGLESSSPFTKRIIDNGNGYNGRIRVSYLIECSGDLLKVVPFMLQSSPITIAFFQVLKLDFEKRKWLEVKTLGSHALFVGSNHGFCVSTSDYPGCKGNSIYYTENCKETYTLGVYNLEDGKIEKIYSEESGGILPWPIWYAQPAIHSHNHRM